MVGSQLLWQAGTSTRSASAVPAAPRLTYLGQLHGAELRRRDLARAARDFCGCHGAVYRPDTGECAGGPCRGGLVKIAVTEHGGVVHWHTAHNLQPVLF